MLKNCITHFTMLYFCTMLLTHLQFCPLCYSGSIVLLLKTVKPLGFFSSPNESTKWHPLHFNLLFFHQIVIVKIPFYTQNPTMTVLTRKQWEMEPLIFSLVLVFPHVTWKSPFLCSSIPSPHIKENVTFTHWWLI